MFDEDKDSSHDFCGSAEFDFGSEFDGKRAVELPLVMANGQRKGSLSLCFLCRTLLPSDPCAAKDLEDKNGRLRRELHAAEVRRTCLEAEVCGLKRALGNSGPSRASSAETEEKEGTVDGILWREEARQAEEREVIQRHFSRQFCMLKAGVPEGVVLNALTDEGIEEGEAKKILTELVAASSPEQVSG